MTDDAVENKSVIKVTPRPVYVLSRSIEVEVSNE